MPLYILFTLFSQFSFAENYAAEIIPVKNQKYVTAYTQPGLDYTTCVKRKDQCKKQKLGLVREDALVEVIEPEPPLKQWNNTDYKVRYKNKNDKTWTTGWIKKERVQVQEIDELSVSGPNCEPESVFQKGVRQMGAIAKAVKEKFSPVKPKTEPKVMPKVSNKEKTSAQLDAWFRTCSAHYGDLQKKYSKAITSAAQIYGIPENHLRCLIWTESDFNANARSGAGALGLAQFTPATTNTFRKYIKGSFGGTPDDHKEIRKMKKAAGKPENGKITIQEYIDYYSIMSQQNRDSHYYKAKLAVYQKSAIVSSGWQKYRESVGMSSSEPIPSNLVGHPLMSIGISAAYLKLISESVKEAQPSNMNDFGMMSVATAAYNMGLPGAARRIAKSGSRNINVWTRAVVDNSDERRQQVYQVNKCLSNKTTAPDTKCCKQPPYPEGGRFPIDVKLPMKKGYEQCYIQ